jgi:leader peptidase (prepilin peptidase)/N-methyltransferase
MGFLDAVLFPLGLLASFIYGLCFGSFANVCIYRMPLDMSIMRPRSSCPKCKTQIKWYDNIPVLSFIVLGAKCRNCKAPLSIQYPLIELLGGVLFALLFYKYLFSFPFFLFVFMAFCLIVISGIDYYYQVIPDIFPLLLAAAGLLTSAFNDTLGVGFLDRFLNSLAGLLAGGGFLFVIGIIGKKIYKKEAMGGGDVKLMAGVGAIIGWEKVLFAIFIGAFLASAIGIILIFLNRLVRKGYMPFGPFLAAGSYLALFLPMPSVLIDALLIFETRLIDKFL